MSNSNKKYEDMTEHKKNNRPEKKPKMDATTIATGKRLLKYVMDSYKYRFILVFICILLSAVASISVSLSLKYLLDDFIIPLIGQKSPNYTELYQALMFPDRSNCNIYLYKNDGIHWTGCVKKSARRYV